MVPTDKLPTDNSISHIEDHASDKSEWEFIIPFDHKVNIESVTIILNHFNIEKGKEKEKETVSGSEVVTIELQDNKFDAEFTNLFQKNKPFNAILAMVKKQVSSNSILNVLSLRVR